MGITQAEIEALEKLLDWAHEEALEQRQSPEQEASAHESAPPMDEALGGDDEVPPDDEGADVEIEMKPKRSVIGRYELGVGGGDEPKPSSKMPVRRRY